MRNLVEEISCSKCKYYADEDYLYIQGDFVYAIIGNRYGQSDYYRHIEESFILQTVNSFEPFASDKLKNFTDYYLRDIPSIPRSDKHIPIVITEGMTDWKYLEWAWKKILNDVRYKDQYDGVDFELYRYVSENYSGATDLPKIQMDCNALLEMCRAYSNRNLGGTYIFISDRDVPQITHQMNNGDSYKCWENGVYSFAIPVPKFRKDMPEICIEHYFTDEEIKTEKTLLNGTKRRLYLSSEFDRFGRAPKINRFCINRKACSGKSIKILDGSGNDKIFSLTDCEDETNYGLPKAIFAESVFSDPAFSHLHYDSFKLIFDVIKSICQDAGKNN